MIRLIIYGFLIWFAFAVVGQMILYSTVL